MKILLISHFFPPRHVAGTELYTYNLGQALKEHGHNIVVLHSAPKASLPKSVLHSRIYEGIPIFEITNHSPEGFALTYENPVIDEQVDCVLDLIKPDLVHINHLLNLSFGVVERIQARQIPMVMTLHDYWCICPLIHLHKHDFAICHSKNIHDCSECIARQGYAYNEDFIRKRDEAARAMLSTVDRLIAPSQFLKTAFAEYFQFNEQRITHCGNGSRIQARQPAPPRPDRPFTIGYFGNICFQKGLHIVLEAFEPLRKQQVNLHIQGKIENASYKDSLDKSFPWWTNYYHGAYSNTETISLMQNHIDALVYPSVIYENYPTVVNESFIAGIPVIGADHGGISEMIGSDKGLLFEALNARDLQEKIVMCMENSEFRQRLKNTLKHYTIKSFEQHVDELHSIYHLLSHGQNHSLSLNYQRLFEMNADAIQAFQDHQHQQAQKLNRQAKSLRMLQKSQNRIAQSREYRLGAMLLNPLRILKGFLMHGRRQ